MTDTIPIRIYLNEELERTEQFDTSKDTSVEVICGDREVELEDLIVEMKSTFRRRDILIFSRLRDKSYVIKFFSYNNHEIEIEDNDDLSEEIDAVFPDSESDDEENNNHQQIVKTYVELRAIFFKKQPSINPKQSQIKPKQPAITLCPHQQQLKHCIQCNAPPIPQIIQPQLKRKRIGRYYDYKYQKMAYFVILQWNDPNQSQIDEKSNDMLLYDIREITTKSDDLCAQSITYLTYTAKPLHVNKQYKFQIKAYLMRNNSIATECKWSESLTVNTPLPPKLYPPPKHLQVKTLRHDRIFIKFDPGFVSESTHEIRYWFKEKNVYTSAPLGVAYFPRPAGGFNNFFNPSHKTYPVKPNIMYQITAYCYNETTAQSSLESVALHLMTPPKDIFNVFYKPNPPSKFEVMYDKETNEIELFWDLPLKTFGDLIQYEMKVDGMKAIQVNDLPYRIPMKSEIIVQIVTVCEVGNVVYKSNEGVHVINASNVDNITVESVDRINGMKSNQNEYEVKKN